jgi:ribosomal protein S9
MIHLHRRIKELKRLIDSKAKPYSISQKSLEIMQACNPLMEKHKSDVNVNVRLGGIFGDAMNINGKLMRLPRFDYDKASQYVEDMEKRIYEIGEILKIEFKEIES